MTDELVNDPVFGSTPIRDTREDAARPAAANPGETVLEDRFFTLVDAWKMEKLFTSSMTAIERSQHYQAIIGLGILAVPLIFRELQREPDYWFTALHAILGADPVPEKDRGNLARMTQHWLDWGKAQGYIELSVGMAKTLA